jgi:trk system potassium uptake protein TrkA
MGRYAVIGLGKFGGTVARALYEKGHEVAAIDRDPEVVQAHRDHCSQAIAADCTDQETIRALGLGDADAVVVSLGERMDASILVTLYLRELGVKRIVAKAVSDDHHKILSLIGATDIIHPERDSALRVAKAMVIHSVVEYLPLGAGFSLVEIVAPSEFTGRTLADLQLRSRYQVLLVGVHREGELMMIPGADFLVRPKDVLLLVGRDEDIETMSEQTR